MKEPIAVVLRVMILHQESSIGNPLDFTNRVNGVMDDLRTKHSVIHDSFDIQFTSDQHGRQTANIIYKEKISSSEIATKI